MATVGSLVVDLRANTAAFETDMGKARGALEKTSTGFKSAENTAVRFASRGLAEVTGGGFALERGLERVIDSTMKGAGALRLLGETAFVVGGVLAVAMAVQKLKEVIGEKFFGIEPDEKRLDRLKQEIEENRKFIGEKQAAAAQEIALRESITKAQTDASVATRQLIGDEVGARQAQLAGELAAINQAAAAKLRAELQGTTNPTDRARITVLIEQNKTAQIVAAEAKAAADIKKIQDETSARQLETWSKDTDKFLTDLERRQKIRVDIEEKGLAAVRALGIGGVIDDLAQVKEFEQGSQAIAREFARQVEAGIPLRDLLPQMTAAAQQLTEREAVLREQYVGHQIVLDALNKTMRSLAFGDFIALVEEARLGLVKAGVDTRSLNEDLAAQAKRLGVELPNAINGQAIPSLDTLIGRFQILKQWVDATNRSLASTDTLLAQ